MHGAAGYIGGPTLVYSILLVRKWPLLTYLKAARTISIATRSVALEQLAGGAHFGLHNM